MKKLFLYLLLISAFLVQCNSENEVTPEPLVQSQSGVGGVLLAEVKPAEGYVVQFLEIEPGTVAMLASYSGDLKDVNKANFAAMNTKGKSMLEIYKTLAKDKVNKLQLKALEAANERLLQSASSLLEVDKSALTLSPGRTQARVDNSQRTNCYTPPGSPDFADDAAWWRDTYGRFYESSANQTDQTMQATARQVEFCAMASAYDQGGYFLVYSKNSNGSWRKWLDMYMDPRTVHFYGLWSNKKHVYRGDVFGIAPCARVNLGYKILIAG
jgi:hypothetical protein